MRHAGAGIFFFVLIASASLVFASAKDSPAYQRTLKKAQESLRLTPVQMDESFAAAIGHGEASAATTDPEALTGCVNGELRLCTWKSAGYTKCTENSQTACSVDPDCGSTTRPAGTTTKCRGQHSFCNKDGSVIDCTAQPANFTECTNSNTYCAKTDPNCFTHKPSPGATHCDAAMTKCYAGWEEVCTREPYDKTQCPANSRTACPGVDPKCPLNPTPVPITAIAPEILPQGSSIEALLAFSGDQNDLITGEMSAAFGEGIEVSDVQVISPVEGWIQLQVAPDAPIGPRDVFMAGGDEESGLGVGEHVVYMGMAFVTAPIPMLGTWGLVIFALVLIGLAIVLLKRKRETTQ